MSAIPDLRLKRFFNEGPATAARANLSPSFAEPLAMAELLACEPEAAERLTHLALAYPGLHGGHELRAVIAGHYTRLAPDHVVVTCGADDALSSLFLALVEPGDHVVVHVCGAETSSGAIPAQISHARSSAPQSGVPAPLRHRL